MGSTITQWDGNLLMEIQHFVIHEGLTPLVKFITHLGDAGSIWIALILLMLCFKKTRRVGIIAATALHHGLTVVTRDMGGYEKAGVPLVNPWQGEP